jgi:hypothetical protein
MGDAVVQDEECVLCSLGGSSDAAVKEISSYIADSLGHVCIGEICNQTMKNLQEHCNVSESKRKIFLHITQHTTDQRVVLGNIMRDLVELSHLAKSSCIYTCEETGRRNIDVKGLSVYLKTVDQITSVYKMENMRLATKKDV